MTAAQRQALLNVKSKHAAGAAEEDYARVQSTLRGLEAKDNAEAERDKITEQAVPGCWRCAKCRGPPTEVEPAGCRLAGHPMERITAVRRFWECTGCRRRTAVLAPSSASGGGGGIAGKLMPRPCTRCRNHGSTASSSGSRSKGPVTWKRCGAGRGVGSQSHPGGGALVASFSENTTYAEKMTAASFAVDSRY